MPEKSEVSFSFGKNWKQYLKEFYDSDKLNKAISSLKEFMGIKNMKGKIFMDIGCGSGLFSLAAHKLGAKKIISFDVDPNSVECCQILKHSVSDPKNWEVFEGSILDQKLVKSLLKADIVYSWGVLHHTGNMWKAIENAASLVKKNGYFYIAIYNKVDRRIGSSDQWLKIKELYNKITGLGKFLMEVFYMSYLILRYIVPSYNLLSYLSNYPKTSRGMSWRRDAIDWLGGYPYEFAGIDEVFSFCKKIGFNLENIQSNSGLGNNEFLFVWR